ncbi:N-acetylmuramoyl-L-alanine amidase [Loktanella sp. 5RATIMAR09]|uniref:N-acetylmuramoyl-L-alanine amidase n=1 Tax=Loktanella sp. 5RATIMAR09 TaxID=1225655 RepID=UPI0006EBC595|nr:N-acetylmuramoyl-L-alanine amidase [Loktanella sp. 5RATIMAR09]KQI73101.1 N-acetylmuramoyl-L-alanine amidase [Loktanella sp. 5RATIMAR09]
MIRWLLSFLFIANMAIAQVTVDPERTSVSDGWWTLEVAVGLDRITPYRVFTLDAPRRLVLDVEGASFDGLDGDALISGDRAADVRFGPLRPGWSRMVVDLAEPLVISEAGMVRTDAGADLRIVLERASAAEFAAAAGAPPDPGWDVVTGFDPDAAAALAASEDFLVVIDPGHGGIDPGAFQGGIKEADLMLILAAELAVMLNAQEGVHAVLTREDDTFVPLSARMTFARQVGADLFLSLHADALGDEDVRGASVYTLSSDGGDAAAQRIVERHERGDLLAGVDLNDAEDRVATALMDLARARTGPEGVRIADALAAAMQAQGVPMNSRPRREGQFVVLTAADYPGVLIEAGFLSNAQDRAFLATPEGRARITRAIRDTVVLLAR